MATILDFDDLKILLGLDGASFADYPSLERTADSVHDALENFTGRKLDSISKVTESGILPMATREINLKNLPITEVSSVELPNTELTLDITKVAINNYGITLPFVYIGAWTVITKGGFKNIPGDVYRAEEEQTIYEYQNLNNLGAESFTNDGGSVSNPGLVLLPQVKQLLAPYRSVDKMGY